MITKNGFSWPLHPFQIMSWVLFFIHTILPFLLIYPGLNYSAGVTFLILFYITHIIVLVIAYLATKSIPTINKSKDPIYLDADSVNFYCTICETYVTKTAKHCGSCDRCVDNFDHHCKWLNNCIGGKNYSLFILLISFLEINEIVLFIFEVNTLSLCTSSAVFGLLVVDSMINSSVILLIGYLISIHIMLKCKGISTYEYIKAQRKKKEKKINPDGQLENINLEEKKSVRIEGDVIKSIIKTRINQSLVENPCSFSIAKVSEPAHQTLEIRIETEISS